MDSKIIAAAVKAVTDYYAAHGGPLTETQISNLLLRHFGDVVSRALGGADASITGSELEARLAVAFDPTADHRRVTVWTALGEVFQTRHYSDPVVARREYERQLELNRTLPVRAGWTAELSA